MRVQSCNVQQCDTKAFMKAICDNNNISLDGQFGALRYLLEKWSASLKSKCVSSWRLGLHICIDPTVRTQSCQLLEVISGFLHARQLQTTFVLVASTLASTGQGSRTTMRRFTTCCPRTALLKGNRWHVGLKNSTHTDFLVRQPCPIRGDAT